MNWLSETAAALVSARLSKDAPQKPKQQYTVKYKIKILEDNWILLERWKVWEKAGHL